MLNEINAIYVNEGFLGKVYSTGAVDQRNVFLNGKRKGVRAYTATSDNVASFTLYAPVGKSDATAEPFADMNLKNVQMMALSNSIGEGRERNEFLEYVLYADAVRVGGVSEFNEDIEPSLVALKFPGGNVTDVIDFEKTLGNLMYLSHTPVFVYEEGANGRNERTDEITGYEMIVVSTKTKKQYKINFDRPDVDFKGIRIRNVITLDIERVGFYQDGGATTQGSTISIKAFGVKKKELKGTHASQKADHVAQENTKVGKAKKVNGVED